MDCKTCVRRITPYIQHELSDEETEDFLVHIHSCASCREELEINYMILEGLRVLDSDEENFDVQGAMDRDIRDSYQRLGAARIMKIAMYAVDTLVAMSVGGMLLVAFRILFWK